MPGGVANVQDIYGLAPLQSGILYHHLATTEGDPYVLQVQLRFHDQGAVDGFVNALHAVIERNDILRTAILWEGLRSRCKWCYARHPWWSNAWMPWAAMHWRTCNSVSTHATIAWTCHAPR